MRLLKDRAIHDCSALYGFGCSHGLGTSATRGNLWNASDQKHTCIHTHTSYSGLALNSSQCSISYRCLISSVLPPLMNVRDHRVQNFGSFPQALLVTMVHISQPTEIITENSSSKTNGLNISVPGDWVTTTSKKIMLINESHHYKKKSSQYECGELEVIS